jgi:hypothetical protein
MTIVSTLKLLKVETVSTFKLLMVDTVSTFNLPKVETVSTFNWLKVDTVSTFKHFLHDNNIAAKAYCMKCNLLSSPFMNNLGIRALDKGLSRNNCHSSTQSHHDLRVTCWWVGTHKQALTGNIGSWFSVYKLILTPKLEEIWKTTSGQWAPTSRIIQFYPHSSKF